MRQPSFLKHAAVYAAGDLLVLAAGFVLLPVYTRRLSVAEFGLLELLERLAEVASICLLTRSIPLAAFAHYKQSRDEDGRRRAAAAGFLFALAAALAGSALLAAAAGPLGDWLQTDRTSLLWLAAAAALFDGLTVVAQALSQARQEAGFFVGVSLAQFVTRLALCGLFVVGLGWGARGVVAASVARSALFAAALTAREWRRGLLWPDRRTLRDMGAFVLPFLPTGLCFFVLNSGDRFFLARRAGADEVGVYGLGYRLALLVGLFSVTPLYRVWSARLYDAADAPDAARVFGRVATRILAAYLFVGLALCLLSEEVITAFAGAAFRRAAPVVAPVVLAYWFQAASVLMESAFYVRRKTAWKFRVALASTVVTVAAYAALIPPYGALGAAYATLVGFAFHAGLTYAAAQRFFPVRYELGRLAALLGSSAGVWLLGAWADAGPAAVPVKVALWLLWPALLWAAGFFNAEEMQWAAAAARRGRALLARRRAARGPATYPTGGPAS